MFFSSWGQMLGGAALLILTMGGGLAKAAEAPPVPLASGDDGACARLAAATIPDTSILSAAIQAAHAPVSGTEDRNGFVAPVPVTGLPAFCRVIGQIRPEPDSDIRFEVWMPVAQWDHRFHAVGNGGYAGSINYAVMAAALKAGKATASTDTGHQDRSTRSGWARGHPARIRDYGWRAIHLTAVAAKRLIASFYGEKPAYSYFMSCSNGGRQGLMEANRFPDDFDGILAGDPSAVSSQTIMSMVWTVQAQSAPGAAIRPGQAGLIRQEVLRQCDAIDGQADGIIADPRQCRFDVSSLTCGRSSSSDCFSPPQRDALRKIMAGPPLDRGRITGFGYPPSGTELGYPNPGSGWDGWIFGGVKSPLNHRIFPTGALQDFATAPYATVDTFDWTRDPGRLMAAADVDQNVRPDLGAFFRRGGKLILFHGWGDAGNPPQASIQFYQEMMRQGGGGPSNARLYMVPGMQHCTGGSGATEFGQYGERGVPLASDRPDRHIGAALQAWVEGGRAPEGIIASFAQKGQSVPGRQRLLCPFPQRAVLRSGADPDRAASYACRASN